MIQNDSFYIHSMIADVFYRQDNRNHGMDVKGIILNHYSGGAMQEDNEKMIERLTGVPVIARVRDGDRELEVDLEVLKRVYD